jgi:N-acyl amino acid synthase of PEP-CTERM/exosortase system
MVETMHEQFTFKKIDSPDLLREVYRLRFLVYCKECHFIDEADYPNGFETDGFDRYAVHFGAFDELGMIVGAVRLILPTCKQFPIEQRCRSLHFHPPMPVRRECAEISRLTISKLYRRETQEKPTQFIRRVSPIALGLCNAMYQECQLNSINHCLALMEKSLWMLLKLHGFIFKPIGPEVNFYGKVTPYLIGVRDHARRGLFMSPSDYSVPCEDTSALS